MYKGPIRSRITLQCQDCWTDFQAKRRDAKRCEPCGKAAKASQTRAYAERNREKRTIRHREEERRRRAKYREEINRQARERYANDPEFRAHRQAYDRAHPHKHPTREQRQQYFAKYYAKHKGEINGRNVERVRGRKRIGVACERCGIDDPRVLCVHHKVPVAKGGLSVESNMETLCRNCHAIAHWEMTADRPS